MNRAQTIRKKMKRRLNPKKDIGDQPTWDDCNIQYDGTILIEAFGYGIGFITTLYYPRITPFFILSCKKITGY